MSGEGEQTNFRAAVETNSVKIAYAARRVNPAITPAIQADDVAMIPHRREGRAKERQANLPAVRVPAEGELPGEVAQFIFAVWIVQQRERGRFRR